MTARPGTRIRWGGHATVRVEMDGVVLLTDPVLRRRLGFLRRQGMVPSGLTAGVDAVLVSHLHHDHLDLPSIRRIAPWVPVIGPPGLRSVLSRERRPVREMRPGEEVSVAGVRVHAVHAEHDGGRSGSRVRGEALGFVAEGPHRVWFAGDTAAYPAMSDLAPLDVALVPVAGWGPSLGPGHLDAAQAAEVLAMVRPALAVPVHWGTLHPAWVRPGGRGYLDTPGPDLREQAARVAPGTRVVVLGSGEVMDVDDLLS